MKIFNFSVLAVATAFLLSSQTGVQPTQVSASQFRGNLQPSISVTTVTASTTNSFPIPAGRSVCIVSRNISQSPGVDYSQSGGSIIFSTSPAVGDVVQLNCW